MNLPRPSANREEYARIMNRGFERFPERKLNYDKFISFFEGGEQKEVVDVFPIKMDYESSSRCNFKCTMCMLSEGNINRKPYMTYEEFAKSLEEQYGLVEIKLQGIGEPLLNPDLFKMIELTVSKDIWIRIATNASLLHINGNYKKLIDKKVGEIQVSIDGATKDTFEKIRRGSNFEQVVENATLLNTYAIQRGEIWRTSCWMLVQKDNQHEIEGMLELAAKMKFTRLTYSIALSGWGSEKWEKINAPKEAKNVLTEELVKRLISRGKELGIEVTFWDVSEKFKWTEKKDKICAWLFSRAFISSDMKIVPCCGIANSAAFCMGDANNFMKEWNNEVYQRMRKQHLEGKIPKICQNCYE